MPSILHRLPTELVAYAPPLAALLIALAATWLGRGKFWLETASGLALAGGWALLHPVAQWPRMLSTPARGTEVLLVPALAWLAATGVLAWRGGRAPRLTAVALALLTGFWLARSSVGLTDYWRVLFGTALLTWLVARIARGEPDRALAAALTLWGGLLVCGVGTDWKLAALVAAAAALGPALTGAASLVPASAIAALLATVEIGPGRLLRGRIGPIEIACLAALASPFVAEAIQRRFGKATDRPRLLAARVAGAAACIAAVWLARRAFFT